MQLLVRVFNICLPSFALQSHYTHQLSCKSSFFFFSLPSPIFLSNTSERDVVFLTCLASLVPQSIFCFSLSLPDNRRTVHGNLQLLIVGVLTSCYANRFRIAAYRQILSPPRRARDPKLRLDQQHLCANSEVSWVRPCAPGGRALLHRQVFWRKQRTTATLATTTIPCPAFWWRWLDLS